MDALIKLSDHFGVSIDQLLGRTPPPPKTEPTVPADIAEMWNQLGFMEQSEIRGEMKGMLKAKKQNKQKQEGTA